jgi:hypothetical protein
MPTTPFSRTFHVRWGGMDLNVHLRNTAYLDTAVDVRLMYFAENGFRRANSSGCASGRSCGATSWNTTGNSTCSIRSRSPWSSRGPRILRRCNLFRSGEGPGSPSLDLRLVTP